MCCLNQEEVEKLAVLQVRIIIEGPRNGGKTTTLYTLKRELERLGFITSEVPNRKWIGEKEWLVAIRTKPILFATTSLETNP